MTKKIAAMLFAGVLAAGCSSDQTPTGTPPPDAAGDPTGWESEATTSETETTSAGPSTSPRGFIPKQIGEEAGAYIDAEKTTVGYTFTIDEIIPGFQCDETPENGGFLGVRMTVTTTPDYKDMMFYISEQDFVVIGADGTQANSPSSVAASQCVPDNEEFPIGGPGPGVTLKALFVLDTDVTSGVMALEPFGATGWEWQF